MESNKFFFVAQICFKAVKFFWLHFTCPRKLVNKWFANWFISPQYTPFLSRLYSIDPNHLLTSWDIQVLVDPMIQ